MFSFFQTFSKANKGIDLFLRFVIDSDKFIISVLLLNQKEPTRKYFSSKILLIVIELKYASLFVFNFKYLYLILSF